MDFYTYIIYSETSNLYYAGITNNLNNRIKEHKKGKTLTTAKANDWQVVYSKSFPNTIEAYKHEQYIIGEVNF